MADSIREERDALRVKNASMKGAVIGKTVGTAFGVATMAGSVGLSSALVFGAVISGPLGALAGAFWLASKAIDENKRG